MSTWLTYSRNPDSLMLPCVCVQIANMPSLSIAAQVEAICIFIADQQNGNPLGLFQHPEGDVETQLRFVDCDKIYHGKMTALLEAMYEYCNSSMHLRFDTSVTQGLSIELDNFIKRHQLPFSCGGLIADDRGTPSCLITPLKQD